ncbi:putative Serine/threonine-protein phosphatase 2A 55 kDa regulatory subunit B delta [Blattamonas nauphoetae]|uniref:Serine/threonine-protein phosphatase 2A 55 kDa regulatory subunit B n=1 Tax=Blattamonas nauphoetae TaxID=2049346 RepID=A0ABQ9WYZ9_9EUKA|nr:putative Serine/threonine-protein phosphatase 2A 55 kDa regulatory subunit B delta [Blattamonas nauphoetae]
MQPSPLMDIITKAQTTLARISSLMIETLGNLPQHLAEIQRTNPSLAQAELDQATNAFCSELTSLSTQFTQHVEHISDLGDEEIQMESIRAQQEANSALNSEIETLLAELDSYNKTFKDARSTCTLHQRILHLPFCSSLLSTNMDSSKHNWHFCQVFGDRNVENVQKADIISAIQFDQSGDYMAAGDNGGRLVLFNIAKHTKSGSKTKVEYNFITEFQSHEPDFDHLRSLEIEERINDIKFLPQRTDSHLLLTTNDKTIKLWKVTPTTPMSVGRLNMITDQSGRLIPGKTAASLRVPTLMKSEPTLLSSSKTIYQNGHTYNINSISLSPDNETFISSDDLRVNMWNFDRPDTVFNLVDIKPDNIEDITQVITCASMHPSQDNIFMYSTSKGYVRICDMRQKAILDEPTAELNDTTSAAARTTLPSPSPEVANFVCDSQYSSDGQYIVSRDFFNIRLWDPRVPTRPVFAVPLHDAIRGRLSNHLDSDAPFDKFTCCFSPDNKYVLTGTYNNRFSCFDLRGRLDSCIEATRLIPQKKKTKVTLGSRATEASRMFAEPLTAETVQFNKRLVKLAWHPKANILALCACSNLYLYAD